MSTTPVIDAHLHVWRLPEPAYPYAPESKLQMFQSEGRATSLV